MIVLRAGESSLPSCPFPFDFSSHQKAADVSSSNDTNASHQKITSTNKKRHLLKEGARKRILSLIATSFQCHPSLYDTHLYVYNTNFQVLTKKSCLMFDIFWKNIEIPVVWTVTENNTSVTTNSLQLFSGVVMSNPFLLERFSFT